MWGGMDITCMEVKRTAAWILRLELRSTGLWDKGPYLLSSPVDPVNNLTEKDALVFH